jgi:hypothetical protein
MDFFTVITVAALVSLLTSYLFLRKTAQADSIQVSPTEILAFSEVTKIDHNNGVVLVHCGHLTWSINDPKKKVLKKVLKRQATIAMG